jgi:hypothetical protein
MPAGGSSAFKTEMPAGGHDPAHVPQHSPEPSVARGQYVELAFPCLHASNTSTREILLACRPRDKDRSATWNCRGRWPWLQQLIANPSPAAEPTASHERLGRTPAYGTTAIV